MIKKNIIINKLIKKITMKESNLSQSRLSNNSILKDKIKKKI